MTSAYIILGAYTNP